VLDLFSAAAGGWSLGMHRAGYRTIAACEVIDWRRALYSENNPGSPRL
jgi:DNA (cytosine-5)-methyltransferase 1